MELDRKPDSAGVDVYAEEPTPVFKIDVDAAKREKRRSIAQTMEIDYDADDEDSAEAEPEKIYISPYFLRTMFDAWMDKHAYNMLQRSLSESVTQKKRKYSAKKD